MSSLASSFPGANALHSTSAPAGLEEGNLFLQNATKQLLGKLRDDPFVTEHGLTLSSTEVLVLKQLLRPHMQNSEVNKEVTGQEFKINIMAAEPLPKGLAPHATGRRSSFTADASRRRRLKRSLSRFDGLEELERQESLLSSGLDSESVRGVFHFFEDHNLWRKRRHGKQFFREAVRKVIRINRAEKVQQASALSRRKKLTSRKSLENVIDMASALNARTAKGRSHRMSTLFQQKMLKFDSHDVVKYVSMLPVANHPIGLALEEINTWNGFDIWALYKLINAHNGDIDQLTGRRNTVKVIAVEIFEKRTHLLSQLHVSPPGFMKFLDLVCHFYSHGSDIPYHNELHGADVMQGLHAMLSKTGVVQVYESDGATKCNVPSALSHALSRVNHFGALLAALCHDIGHPGYTNRFLVRTSDPIAVHYNDQSVLENMHVATALKLARECMIFSCFTGDERRSVRHLMIEMILETDMSRHMSSLWKLEHDLEAARVTPESEGSDSVESNYEGFSMKNYVNTLSLMLHACDLGNPTKSWQVYRKWTSCIMEEFYAQSSKEKELNISLSLPTRETCKLDQFQIGFIRFIQPFFSALNCVPALDLSEQLENLSSNERKWGEIGDVKPNSSAAEIETKTKA